MCVRTPGAKEKTMKKTKKLLALLLALTLLFGATVGLLSSCTDPDDSEGDPCTTHVDADKNGKCDECGETVQVKPTEKTTYTVSVKTVGGMPIEGATVVVYADSTLDDMEGYASTDANGLAQISLYPSNTYAIELSGVPDGYSTEDYYTFTGTSAVITLASRVLPDNGLSGVEYTTGDIMHDFTVTTMDGETLTLSELLDEKKLVMLNFWYIDCSACQLEFPALEESYKKYSEDVAVIALNPKTSDSDASIGIFRNQYGLTFDVARDNVGLTGAFGVNNFPTSVFIDRYGAITFIEIGALTETKYFDKLFGHYTAEPYVQKIIEEYEDIAPVEKPDITQPSSDEIAAVISPNAGITYYPETGTADAEYSWPFIIGEKDGVPCIMTSNAQKDNSFSTMHADVTLEAGQVLELEYYVSTEYGADLLYILVNGVSINTISGEGTGWQTCYPYVAKESGTYKVSFLYLKDSSTDAADDCVYIRKLSVTSEASIDTPTYIPRWAATVPSSSGIGYDKYATVVLNPTDGYYHVGDENGPLLLANLMGITPFSSSDSVYSIVYNSAYTGGNLAQYYDAIIKYCNYASNASVSGLCTVDAQLAEHLKRVADEAGYEENNDKQWLQFCLYYDAYGTGGKQLEDPIAGLSAQSAYKAVMNETVGLDEYPNVYTYNRPIMPKGLWFEFVPGVSGAYRIVSNEDNPKGDIAKTLLGWIFREDGSLYYQYAISERILNDSTNVYMYAYLEAGESYYIDIAYYDIYAYDTFGFKIEYLGESYEHFRAVSPGAPFTYKLGVGYELYEMNGTLVEGGNDFYASITTNEDIPTKAFYDEVIYSLTRDNASSTDDIEVYLGKDQYGNQYLKVTIDSTKKEITFECNNPALSNASLSSSTVKYKLVEGEVTETVIPGGTKVVYDAAEDRYYNVLPDGSKGSSKIYADFTFFTGVFNNKSLVSMINPAVLFKDSDGKLDRVAGMLSLNLYKELVGKDEAYSYVKSAVFNGVSYTGFTKKSGAENELAGVYEGYNFKTVNEEIVKAAKLVVTIDAEGNATLEQFADPNGSTVTITKTGVKCEQISFAFNFEITENDHNGLIYLVNYPTDDALRAYWGDDYDDNYSLYMLDDLKSLEFHGRGQNYTELAVKYVSKMITATENPMDPDSEITEYPTELLGCVEVNKELAGLLQVLMDKYTFEGVENSWVKLCYYYETIGEGWEYISELR